MEILIFFLVILGIWYPGVKLFPNHATMVKVRFDYVLFIYALLFTIWSTGIRRSVLSPMPKSFREKSMVMILEY